MNTMYFPAVCVCPYYIFMSQCHNIQVEGVTLKARAGHSLTAFSLGPGLTVVEFGGCPESVTGIDETQPKMADTTLLEFSEFAHM